jgi:hypothetical protein
MPTWAIIVLAVFGALLVLALFGGLAASIRNRRRRERFGSSLDEVDRSLADARATDRGWERGVLEAAARRAFEAERPGAEIHELTLVQVVDRPGTEEDKAVFRVVATDIRVHLTLGRVGGEWVGEAAEGP